MNLLHRAATIFAALSLCFATGCYLDRMTWHYGDLQELGGDADALLEEADGLSEEELQEREEELKKLSKTTVAPYTINAGDGISIVVYNHADLSINTVVTPDGYIGMVLIGQIKISGLTMEQAAKKIEQELSKYIRNPKVGISPTSIQSETVTLSGAVNKPGMYKISNGMRLADIVAMASGTSVRLYGGQAMDAADFEKSVFVRDGKTIHLDFSRAIKQGDPLHNILLRKGDYIYIAAKDDSMVYVVGDVEKPQQRLWHKGLGVLELLADCNWLNETHWSNVIIIRGGLNNPKMYKVDLDGILCGKKHNVQIQPGDIVYMPHDSISEYNVFIRKLFPTAQLVNMVTTPMFWYTRF